MQGSSIGAVESFKDLAIGCTFYWLPRGTAGSSSQGCYQKIGKDVAAELGTGAREELCPDEIVLLRREARAG